MTNKSSLWLGACHCGSPTMDAAGLGADDFLNETLRRNFCLGCATVRCDAFPGACASATPQATIGKLHLRLPYLQKAVCGREGVQFGDMSSDAKQLCRACINKVARA